MRLGENRRNILNNILSDRVEIEENIPEETVSIEESSNDELVLEFSSSILKSDMELLKTSFLENTNIENSKLYKIILDFPDYAIVIGDTNLTLSKYRTLQRIFPNKLNRIYIRIKEENSQENLLSLETYMLLNINKNKNLDEIEKDWKVLKESYSNKSMRVGSEIEVNEEYLLSNDTKGSINFGRGGLFDI